MSTFSGQRVLVTGGTTGIGLATAKQFHAQGARVIVTGRNEKTLAAARAELPPEVQVVASDAGSLTDVDSLVETVRGTFGGLDVVFVNAGIGRFAPFEAVTEDDQSVIVWAQDAAAQAASWASLAPQSP